MTAQEAAALALSLPDAIEKDHHGRRSFRVGDDIFATLPDTEHMNVMLDEDGVFAAVDRHPECCDVVRWGAKVAAVGVDLRCASAEVLRPLLVAARERKGKRRR